MMDSNGSKGADGMPGEPPNGVEDDSVQSPANFPQSGEIGLASMMNHFYDRLLLDVMHPYLSVRHPESDEELEKLEREWEERLA